MLVARPITLRVANAYVAALHRHSKPVRGQRFSIGASLPSGELVGVAIVGNPRARMLDDGYTTEVLRVCTDGTRNTCSFLYARAWRAAAAMGYTRIVTYTLESEPGASLRAAGWRCVARVDARDWDRPGRARDATHHEVTPRLRWEIVAPGREALPALLGCW